MSLVTQAEAEVLERSNPMEGAVELVLHAPDAAARVKPGQFFQLTVNTAHAILRRPYSIAWSDPHRGRIGFIFNVVGAGSAWLASRHHGDTIDLLGPLGSGFSVEQSTRPAVCIAGGIGVATFPALVTALQAAGRQVILLHGARTGGHLLPPAMLPGVELRTATDDGSAGHKGSVLELLRSVSLRNADVFACGPTPMLRGLVDAARRLELPLARIQVALETPMGCGFGTCLGCVTPKHGGGYLLTCTDGPCIRADRVDWQLVVDSFHG